MNPVFELTEIPVCARVPPPDPAWGLLMACCKEVLNTAANAFRLRSAGFDAAVAASGNNLLACMRDMVRADTALQVAFDATDEILQLVALYERIVGVPSERQQAETKQLLSQVGTRMIRAAYHYTVTRPIVVLN